ncbi:intracellular septation protein involved in cell division(ntracellular septation protein A,14-187) [Magnetospirillum sp. XM-1]|uniref:septation protein A n=1 Tax=Magnetospirillum sp. XM-1 TaxID=1663591 RepID=UPI00073DC9F1|nr:septation protein A [Magnetospirillum sp. XM-1]CUW38971.1 intracellular septation protein involved in cell division(ntracellular septation protein A,14-187) [Magnetospirillum sp. XM-1]
MSDQQPANQAPKWLKPAVDFGPLAVFLGLYWLKGLLPATAALMAATAVALVLSFVFTRKVALMPLVTALVVGVFGGLTLWLNDETFIMMKPSIVYGLFAAVLGGGLVLNRPTVKAVLGEALSLDDDGWRALSLRFCLFFIAMALANEVVRRVASLDVWVLWKVPGSMAATFVFMLFQMPLIRRHMVEEAPTPGE